MQKPKTDIARLALRRVAFNPEVAKLIGLNEAILLSQLEYWSDKTGRNDGWLYKTKEELTDETSLSRFQQDQARGKLQALGLIETKVRRANGKPTIHYRVAFPKVRNLLYEALETDDSEKRETRQCITENTQESTTENSRKESGPTKAELLASFERFYETYPKKKSRGDAEKAWLKLKPSERLTRQIIQKVVEYRTTRQWHKDNGQFIPYPASFINQKRYLDDISQEPKVGAGENSETLDLT